MADNEAWGAWGSTGLGSSLILTEDARVTYRTVFKTDPIFENKHRCTAVDVHLSSFWS